MIKSFLRQIFPIKSSIFLTKKAGGDEIKRTLNLDIIKKITGFLLGVGVKESYSSLLNRRIRFTNFIALSGFFSTFLYTLIIAGMDHRFLGIAYISSTVGLLYLLPVVLNACGKINLSRFLLLNYSLMIVFMFIHLHYQ